MSLLPHNKAKHSDSFSVAASPSLQSCACWQRYTSLIMKVRKLALIVFLLISQASVAEESEHQDAFVVSDYGYYFKGSESDDLETYKNILNAQSISHINLVACLCADAERVQKALDFIREQGIKNISIASLDDTEELSGYCGSCK